MKISPVSAPVFEPYGQIPASCGAKALTGGRPPCLRQASAFVAVGPRRVQQGAQVAYAGLTGGHIDIQADI